MNRDYSSSVQAPGTSHGQALFVPELRWFKVTFTTIGAIYILLASSMLVRGVVVLRDFGVDEAIVSSPVMADFFSFFYELMAVFGVVMILFGRLVKERRSQILLAGVFSLLSVLAAFRDLATSDSRFGSRVYKGEQTLVFVLIDVIFALAFGVVALRSSARAPT